MFSPRVRGKHRFRHASAETVSSITSTRPAWRRTPTANDAAALGGWRLCTVGSRGVDRADVERAAPLRRPPPNGDRSRRGSPKRPRCDGFRRYAAAACWVAGRSARFERGRSARPMHESGQTTALACSLADDATRATRRNKSVIPCAGRRGCPGGAFPNGPATPSGTALDG